MSSTCTGKEENNRSVRVREGKNLRKARTFAYMWFRKDDSVASYDTTKIGGFVKEDMC
jgi:hypothetical protein